MLHRRSKQKLCRSALNLNTGLVPGRSLSVFLALATLLGCREAQTGGARPKEASRQNDVIAAPKTCDELACAAPTQCEIVSGAATCVCPRGYTGTATDCQDVDECVSADMNDCGENARCQNRAGTYECVCNSGFGGDGRVCTALSNCNADSNTCHADAICSTGDTGISCTCSKGFEGDGKRCADVDECMNGGDTCADHATCINRRGSFACACAPGYEGDGQAQCRESCQVALADRSRCAAGARCALDSAGAAACSSCESGYAGDGKTCRADAECAALDCGDNTVCVGTAGSRRCECAPGFEGNPASGCADIDECAGANSCESPSNVCVNVSGGYVCACAEGFERIGGACVNIDECARGVDLCDPAATCTDRSPGFDCECKSGFTGDGRTCRDIDECETMGDAACSGSGDSVTCQNTRGGFECRCPEGYTGNPKDGCYCDLSGYWALRQDSSLTVPEQAAGDVVLLARTTTRASLWELKRYRYDGSTLRVETKQCGGDRGPEVFSPHYEEVYSSAIPNSSYDRFPLEKATDIALARSAAQPGAEFKTPAHAAVYGLKMNDPLNDPWPLNYKDVPKDRWVDADEDGEPGITFWPVTTTTRTGRGDETYDYLPVTLESTSTVIQNRGSCVSVALRNINHLEGRIEGCGRIIGRTITHKIEARIHSCAQLRKDEWDTAEISCTPEFWSTARRCTADQVQFLEEQDQTTESSGTFELVKLSALDAESIDCESVRKRLPALPR